MTDKEFKPILGADEQFCSSCGEVIKKRAEICTKCGVRQSSAETGNSEKSFVTTLLLCFLLGSFGAHRFYTGKIGTGILMLLTLGCLGIWTIIDLIVIVVGKFKDSNGLPIKS